MYPGILRLIVLLSALSLLSGCASFSQPVGPDTRADPALGYVYGIFAVDNTSNNPLPLRMGLVLESEDHTRKYTIEFESGYPIVVTKVEPGTYSLSKFVYVTGNSVAIEDPIAAGPLSRPFRIEAGKAYYLADFDGIIRTLPAGTSLRHQWKINSIRDNFSYATDKFKRTYPGLAQLPAQRALRPE